MSRVAEKPVNDKPIVLELPTGSPSQVAPPLGAHIGPPPKMEPIPNATGDTKIIPLVTAGIDIAKSSVNASILIEIPLGLCDSISPNRRIDVALNDDHAKKLRRVLNGLKRDNARMSDGKPVWSNADVVRWVLDQIT